MIAKVGIIYGGNSVSLVEVDLMRFTEEEIRSRMEEKGISEDSFFIAGFSDWDVEYNLTLTEAYLIKKVILELYDGDDYVIVEMLKRRWLITEVISNYYIYVGQDECDVMKKLLKDVSMEDLVEFFYRAKNWVTVVQSYIYHKQVFLTRKGFYVVKDL